MLKTTLPENRRGLLRALLSAERPIRILEAHNGLSALIANHATASRDGQTKGFDGIWISGLAETASRGLPDIELQGMMARMALIREIAAVTDKAIVVDGDTGGTIEQLQYHIRTLESLGVSALVIEDKVFPKNNSLDLVKPQILEDKDRFAHKINEGKKAQQSPDFMLIARIEALIAGEGLEEALDRAEAYVHAGADALVIHSRERTPDEVLAFAERTRSLPWGRKIPLVAIPTTYGSITEDALFEAGFGLVIYANFLLRSAFVAMKQAAETILASGRTEEAESLCCSLTELFQTIEAIEPSHV